MDKQEKLKAKVLADTLRLMATKIENGFPLTDEQINALKSLSKEIVWLHPKEYNKPTPSGWKRDEPELVDSRPIRRTTLPETDVKIKKQKQKAEIGIINTKPLKTMKTIVQELRELDDLKKEQEENKTIGREPGE